MSAPPPASLATAPIAPDQPEAELTDGAFAALLDPLGPFEPEPRLAIAVSGGPDSMALAILADAWARARGGTILTLIVDHALRPASAAEAALTRDRLAAAGITARILTLTNLPPGPALAARARAARYNALTQACRDAGIVHLLLGHHLRDQAETRLMRESAASGPAGLAGMATLAERPDLRLLRPLLAIPPAWLKATLRARSIAWITDPSNADLRTERARIRAALDDPAGASDRVHVLAGHCAQAAAARARSETCIADTIARRVRFSPLGYAVLSPGPIAPDALSAVLRMLSGRDYPPTPRAIARLAADPRPATLSGLRLLDAGRLGPGLLILREHPPPQSATSLWDRFRLAPAQHMRSGDHIAPAPPGDLPRAITRAVPALWRGGAPVAAAFRFTPAVPAAPAPFQGVNGPDERSLRN